MGKFRPADRLQGDLVRLVFETCFGGFCGSSIVPVRAEYSRLSGRNCLVFPWLESGNYRSGRTSLHDEAPFSAPFTMQLLVRLSQRNDPAHFNFHFLFQALRVVIGPAVPARFSKRSRRGPTPAATQPIPCRQAISGLILHCETLRLETGQQWTPRRRGYLCIVHRARRFPLRRVLYLVTPDLNQGIN